MLNIAYTPPAADKGAKKHQIIHSKAAAVHEEDPQDIDDDFSDGDFSSEEEVPQNEHADPQR